MIVCRTVIMLFLIANHRQLRFKEPGWILVLVTVWASIHTSLFQLLSVAVLVICDLTSSFFPWRLRPQLSYKDFSFTCYSRKFSLFFFDLILLLTCLQGVRHPESTYLTADLVTVKRMKNNLNRLQNVMISFLGHKPQNFIEISSAVFE